jgi:hypothetical protein
MTDEVIKCLEEAQELLLNAVPKACAREAYKRIELAKFVLRKHRNNARVSLNKEWREFLRLSRY